MGKTSVAQMSSLQSTSGHLQGTWGLEGFPPPLPRTVGPQEESFRPPALPAAQACPHARPGLALGPHSSLHSAGPSKDGPEPRLHGARIPSGRAGYTKPQVIIPCSHKRLGLVSRLQQERRGEAPLERPHAAHVSSGDEWESHEQMLNADVGEGLYTHDQGPFQGY